MHWAEVGRLQEGRVSHWQMVTKGVHKGKESNCHEQMGRKHNKSVRRELGGEGEREKGWVGTG